MAKPDSYVGIENDKFGGMTDIGRIIRDAWAFNLIPETEQCTGWNSHGIERLWQQVQDTWALHGYQVAGLPAETRERYLRIQDAAIKQAKAQGWDPELRDDEP